MTPLPLRIIVSLLVLTGVLVLPGCTLLGKKNKDVPEATLPSWLGRVVMVDALHRFALVDTGAPVRPPVGAPVMTFRDKRRTSTLRVTEEARPPYLALEIIEGLPALDDKAALDETRPVDDSRAAVP
jgi:hypothetical protein